MAHHLTTRRATLLAWTALGSACAFAQESPTTPTTPAPTALPSVSVIGQAVWPLTIGGFGDLPLSKTPLQASVRSTAQLQDNGAQRLADLTKLDAGVSDAYSSIGYYQIISVRGFTLDQRFNYRRDGLPINAETALPLGDVDRVEVLKGTSGMQAGTSAPGGLVNLVVKRPTELPLRQATLQYEESGSVLGAVDLSQRFGHDHVFGVRLNVSAERLDPTLRDAKGHASLFALAGDWRAPGGGLFEAEVERGEHVQPSQPGFSLLGDTVPAPVDPRINLNNQPWSLPVVFRNTTGSLRYTQPFNDDWKVSAHLQRQELKTDDRVAFPFGCGKEGQYDRYCSDGTYDLYDFRSDGERRTSDALELAAHGRFDTPGPAGPMAHDLSVGVLYSRYRGRANAQAYNATYFDEAQTEPGFGNVQGTVFTLPNPALTSPGTNRDERSTELFLRDAIRVDDRWTAWLGLRHTSLHRSSVQTDGANPTAYGQSFTTPWVALSAAIDPHHLVYVSWGQGTESDVVPNRPQYHTPGAALPAIRSRQIEAGIKGDLSGLEWSVAAFDITHPVYADAGPCDADATCTRQPDGDAKHRGIDADLSWRTGPWQLDGGLEWLHARRSGSIDDSVNGQRPTNVPAQTLKLQGRYAVAAVPGLNLGLGLRAESDRQLLPDDAALRVGGFTSVRGDARYVQRLDGGTTLTWRAAIDNLFDRRAWRESPYQYSHVYLFPLDGRTVRLSLQAAW